MLNDVLMTRFVAILSWFVSGPNGPNRRDARVSAGFAETQVNERRNCVNFFVNGDARSTGRGAVKTEAIFVGQRCCRNRSPTRRRAGGIKRASNFRMRGERCRGSRRGERATQEIGIGRLHPWARTAQINGAGNERSENR